MYDGDRSGVQVKLFPVVLPEVADGETASGVEGSCDYVEQAVIDCRQRAVLLLGEGLGDGLTTPHLKKSSRL